MQGLAIRERGILEIISGTLIVLVFDGVDDYVDAGTALGDALGDNYAGSLTVSLWFKNGVIGGDDGLFYIGAFTGNLGPFMIQMTSTAWIRYSLGNMAWYREVAFTDTGSWHHLVCVYAAGSAANSKLYLDGVAITGTISEGFVIANDMDFAGKKNNHWSLLFVVLAPQWKHRRSSNLEFGAFRC